MVGSESSKSKAHLILVILAVWLNVFSKSEYGGEFAVYGGVMPVAVIVGAATAALTIVSLLAKAPSVQTIRKFPAN